jgi:hypothetical protein
MSAHGEVPIRLENGYYGMRCWWSSVCDLTRIAPEPAKAEIPLASGGTFKVWTHSYSAADLVYVHDDICPPGEHDPLTDTRTRRQALEDLAKGGRWYPKPKPWFGEGR